MNNMFSYKSLRVLIILLNDLLILNISLYISYFLRTEAFIDLFLIENVILFSNLVYCFIFFVFAIYKQYFRYFNYNSFSLYLKFFICFLFLFSLFTFIQTQNYLPRSLSLIFPSFFFLLLISNRIFVAKILKHKYKKNYTKSVIFGFNYSNINTLATNVKIECIIDDSKKYSKRIINGIKILSSKEFNNNYSRFNFDIILINNEITFNKSKNKLRKYIMENNILVQKIFIKNNQIFTKPYFDFNYFFNRKNKINKLGKTFNKKVILITGAGGSVGSHIVYQLLKSNYKQLILLDISEYNLYNLSQSIPNNKNINLLLKDYSNNKDIEEILSKYKVDIIFHAAAYKHVPLIELNPFSALKNNFLDSYKFMQLSSKYLVPYFCLISSDKAVRPKNIMGATKRLSELAMIYLSNSKSHNTTFCAVRFGNVINSSGSVMPLFQNQIDKNIPVTLTHKKIIRYFMKIEEAANLVLNTYKIAKGGEIFLLDMGEPIKLYDLARLMIQFSGKKLRENGDGDIEIKVIGLRKGEKLYEELLVDEMSKKTEINQIYQSLEKKITNREFIFLLKKINDSYKSNSLNDFKIALKNNFINYSTKNEN